MTELTDRLRLLWHPVAAGGTRRARVFAVVAFVAFDVAAVMAATVRDDEGSSWRTLCVSIASVLAIVAVSDALRMRWFRRAWMGEVTKAWCVRPRSPGAAIQRRPMLQSASRSWDGVLTLAQVSSVLASALVVIEPAGAILGVLPFAVITNWVAVWLRIGRGRISSTVEFPDGRLKPGRTGGVLVQISAGRSDLRAETTTFELRCVRSLPSVLGVFPRSEVLAIVATTSERQGRVASTMWRWGLHFDLPSDLPGADLLAPRPIHWELRIECLGAKSAYRDVVLLPVVDVRF